MGYGKFFVMEGVDGSGKSTVCPLVVNKLQGDGYKVFETREPTKLATGILLRERLSKKDKSIYSAEEGKIDTDYFFADRVEHNRQIIKPRLAEGYNVVSDRYYWSTLAYQQMQNVPLDYLMNEKLIPLVERGEILKPNLVLLFDVSVDTAMGRLEQTGKMKEKFEGRDFLKGVRQKYHELRGILDDRVVVIDAERNLEEVVQSAYGEIKKILVAET